MTERRDKDEEIDTANERGAEAREGEEEEEERERRKSERLRENLRGREREGGRGDARMNTYERMDVRFSVSPTRL